MDATLRIVPADLADRVDGRRKAKRARYLQSLTHADGRMPEKAHGKYLAAIQRTFEHGLDRR